jgi:L-asparaginase
MYDSTESEVAVPEQELIQHRIHVLTVGGTIAMAAQRPERGVEPALDAKDLLSALPGLPPGTWVTSSSFRQVPGAHLTLRDMVELRHRTVQLVAEGHQGVVITQGTDTIEETAFALDLLSDTDVPIVVTGAMRHPGQAGADGAANLLSALRLASSADARGQGVLVTLNDEVHTARHVRKSHTSRPSAFDSPALGPIGWIAENRVRIPLRTARRVHINVPPGAQPEPVALYTAALGDDGRMLPHLLELGYAGLVLAGFGAGHLPARLVNEIEVLARQMPVVLASRAAAGETYRNTYGFSGSERDLLSRGIISAGVLAPLKARILLSLSLAANYSNHAVAQAYDSLST